ncbi:MAG: hypothetical protein V7L14_23040 [Nostoc sp.]|uniref:hypothetical protein n=1 Tax=Nostoc sp. TaxID=1180 RepID=UPI002FFB089D
MTLLRRRGCANRCLRRAAPTAGTAALTFRCGGLRQRLNFNQKAWLNAINLDFVENKIF